MKNPKHSQIRNTKTLSVVNKPARKPHSATSISSEGNNGFSIVFVLTATLILIAGTTTLLNQSTSAMLGSIFQGQSLQARNVARSGMAYLISLLNKKENRHLLVLKDSQVVNNSEALASPAVV
ncbi:MAG: hypothetical protein HQ469_06825 [Cyanobacteria bacterium]|nr:hypothetical protein [Cyanobacteria bacterium bin.275]